MYRLYNNSIYGNEKSLFIANGDHNLIEIAGDSVPLVEEVINGFKIESSLENIFEKLKTTFDNDQTYFNEICDWLITNRILEKVNDQVIEKKTIPTFFLNLTTAKSTIDFSRSLSDDSTNFQFQFNEELEKENAELILVFAPLFENLNEVLALNEFAYKKNIPICHVGFDSSSVFTLGPLVYSDIKTPCLNCYIKRKLVNLKKPQKTLSFIQHVKKNIYQSDYSQSLYSRIAIEHLRIELEKFFRSDRKLCSLLGKSIVFDNSDYSIVKTRILKTPDCIVCNSNQNYSPFNI